MNLNELNETGHSLWVFVVTTFVIFGVLALIWGFSYQLNKYKSLPEAAYYEARSGRVASDESEIEPRDIVTWQVRLYQFLRLLRHGHVVWAWKSGIVFSLLTSGRKGFMKSCSEHGYRNQNGEGLLSTETETYMRHHLLIGQWDSVHEPCAYIIVHLELRRGFKCSKLETAS
ncbi:MAG: hypothetical protein M1820_000751 [Bogoriella megaspora]|nr:MAG: hypothetical protein M1820_000751 [Bogoriella megaspora]